MSSRQMRRLRQQQDLLQAGVHAEPGIHEAEESSEEEPRLSKPRASMFAGLATLEDSDEHEDAEDELDEDIPQSKDDVVQIPETKAPAKSRKKSKKRRKNEQTPQRGAAADAGKSKDEDLDEIDRALKDLAVSFEKPVLPVDRSQWGVPTESAERLAELLRINFHQLKAINEMRKLFGRDVIEAARAEEAASATGARRHGAPLMENVDLETFLKGRPGESLPEILLRKNPFIEGKATWPRAAAGGLTMKQISGSDVFNVEFAFAHDKTYQEQEEKFFSLARGYDAMPMIQFLHQHPYHVSSLVQVSKIAKQDQNSALAAELCERALFTMGRVTLSAFRKKLEEGRARLSFRRPENRQFSLAAYQYIKCLILKGTYKTALEWAKLLLGVDPYDAYATLHFIHPLAIRAHEAQWFVDLCESALLDQYRIEEAGYIRQTLTLAWLQLRDTARAKSCLAEGMRRMPSLYCSLFSALNLDAPKSLWGTEPRTPDEDLFNHLYIHMTKDLWSSTETLNLLKLVATEIPKPDVGALAEPLSLTLKVVRFVYLDNTPSLMAKIPAEMLSIQPNFDFDPLPPGKHDNTFSYESQQRPWGDHRLEIDLTSLRADIERAGGPERVDELLRQFREAREGAVEAEGQEGAQEEEETSVAGLPGILGRLFNIMSPWRGPGDNQAQESEEDSSDEGEMPPLERLDGAQGSARDDSTSDDEMPPPVPG